MSKQDDKRRRAKYSLEAVRLAEKATARKRGPVPQWQQHIEAIARLPRSRQQFVAEMLRNVLGEGAAR